jgi:hypothetical protein
MRARYFLLRAVRHGPLLPARLYWCDHGPDDPPENRLDRGRLSLYPRADIGGVEVEPEQLADRLFSMTDPRPAHPPSHWRFAKAISAEEYRWLLDTLRRTEECRPDDPLLRPGRRLAAADVDLPDFSREEATLL